jgi:hypothetical protein
MVNDLHIVSAVDTIINDKVIFNSLTIICRYSMSGVSKKYIVFDLDETIGHFYLIRLIWESICEFISYNKIPYTLTQKDFNSLIETFPEILRPDILNILSFLKRKKRQGICKGVMIYTNNKYNSVWVKMIIQYIEDTLNGGVFDRTVLAFKLNGEIQEPCRTSNEKKLSDFIACCKLPSNIKLCYFDDNEFPDMYEDNVYYWTVKPYYYYYTSEVIQNRIFASNILSNIILVNGDMPKNVIDRNKVMFIKYMSKFLNIKHMIYKEKEALDYELDKIVSKRMLTHLNIFFNEFVSRKLLYLEDSSDSNDELT